MTVRAATAWMEQAACRDAADVEAWHPRHGQWDAHKIVYAVEHCRVCPVQVECLDFAMSVPAAYDSAGIYGGLTPADRSDLRTAATEPVIDQRRERLWIGGPPHDERRRPHLVVEGRDAVA